MSLLKKRLSCITTSTLLISSVLGAAPNLYAKSTNISYPFSDQQTEGWVSRGSASVTTTAPGLTAEPDDYCLYVSNRGDAWHGVQKELIDTLIPGETYHFSAWIKYDEGQENEHFKLTMQVKQNGTDDWLMIAEKTASKGEWFQLEADFTVPADTTSALTYIEAVVPDGAPKDYNYVSYYVDKLEISGNFKDTSPDVGPDVWSFEGDNLGPWTNRGSAKIAITDLDAHSGNQCVLVSNREQSWQGIEMDPTAGDSPLVAVKRPYTYSAWVKYDNEAFENRTFALVMQYDSAGTTEYKWINNQSATCHSWKQLSGTFTLPSDAANVRLYIQIYEADGEALSDFYVDDISIKAEPYVDAEIQDLDGIKDAYSSYFKIGTALASSHMNEQERELVLRHFNSITCENAMKPESMLDREATLNYMAETGDQTHPKVTLTEDAKTILKFANENNIPMRGHTLAWHSQTPVWLFTENYSNSSDAQLVSPDVMKERLKNYTYEVFKILHEQYPNVEFYAFDVVNEAINPNKPDGFRDPATVSTGNGQATATGENEPSLWISTIGPEYIRDAFQYAHDAINSPEFEGQFANTKLAYNDYNECNPVKAQFIYDVCKPLYDDGILDVIGMQGHYDMNGPTAQQFEDAIKKYASIGDDIEIQVTELDVNQPDNSQDGMVKQAYRYKMLFETLKRLDASGEANIGACVVWGVKDDESWRSNANPLLFDADYQAKPAYYGIVDPTSLPILAQEVKAYSVTNSVSKTLEMQNSIALTSTSGSEVAKFKIAWDKDNIYVNVIPTNSPSGTVKVFVGDTVKSTDLTYNTLLTIPYSTSDATVPFDIFVQNGTDKATWNDLSYDGSSTPNKNNFGKLLLKEAPKFMQAVYGTPTIDGTIDSIWSKANTVDVNTFSEGSDGATATAKVLWDADNVYVLMKVKDPLLSKASADTYQQDSVEIFIDEDNAKSSSYEHGDVQYRVNFDNEPSINGVNDVESFTSATSLTDDGYIVEIAIPSRLGGFTANQMLGFDFQVNDDADGDGKRDNVSNWNDLTGQGYQNTSSYGVIELLRKKSSSGGSSSSSSSTTPSTPAADSTTGSGNGGGSSSTSDTTLLNAITLSDDNAQNATITPATAAIINQFNDFIDQSSTNKAINSTKYTIEVSAKDNTANAAFEKPVQLSFDLSKEDLSDTQTLSLARIYEKEDGTIAIERLGGSYNEDTGIFTTYITQPGSYSLITASDLVNIQMTIGDTHFAQNQADKELDVAPQLINNTTMLPLRAIAEMLGAEVKWDAKAKQVTIIQEDKTITLDTKAQGDATSAVIVNGRTLVPLRYIAEQLDVNVLWIPDTKSIQITK